MKQILKDFKERQKHMTQKQIDKLISYVWFTGVFIMVVIYVIVLLIK
jgi:hypothetical protein